MASVDFLARVGALCSSGQGSAAAIVQRECDDIVRWRFPNEPICPAPDQGFCSYSLLVGDSKVLQYRLASDPLHLDVIEQARQVYADLVPKSELLGSFHLFAQQDHPAATPVILDLYLHERVPGVSLARYRIESQARLPERQHPEREALVREFARFATRGFDKRVHDRGPPTLGRVGRSIQWRLEMLRDGLPERFRPIASSSLDYYLSRAQSSTTPWVLTHGDVVPGNIMVQPNGPDGPKISGMLDWAEAEWLPMGIQLYGLEELLGESSGGNPSTQYPPPRSVFRYYPGAERLREAFWDEVKTEEVCSTGVASTWTTRDDLDRCRVIGILLWHGIAWDDGRLDRVVQQKVDDAEIQRLDLFLLGREEALPAGEDSNHGDTVTDDDAKPTTVERTEDRMLDDILDDDDDVDAVRSEQLGEQKSAVVCPHTGQVSSRPVKDDGREKKPGLGRKLLDYVFCRGKL